jgi:hypothetical protein
VNPKDPPATTREVNRNQSRRESLPVLTRTSHKDHARVPSCATAGSSAA